MTSLPESSRHDELSIRIKKLKSVFDFKQSIRGITKNQEDKLRSLILLAHAEFEDYFESLALKLISDSESIWRTTHHADYYLASLFITSEKIQKNETIETKATYLIKKYRELVEHNNGLTEEYIMHLFKPLGFDSTVFEQDYLAVLTAFGKQRGALAHTAAIRTQQQLDKQTEYERIDRVLEGIIEFENALNSKVLNSNFDKGLTD